MSSPAASADIRVLGDVIPGERVRDVALVVGFAVAIAASAQVAIPLPGTPVPVTGQTFAVLLGAIVLGAGRATSGSLLYLAAGVAGVPWFAVTGGATIGYIVGFVAAAALLGRVAERGYARGPLQVAGAMVVGNLVIYAFGVTGLALVTGMGASAAIAAGLIPFLIGDTLKIALATAIVPTAWTLVNRGR